MPKYAVEVSLRTRYEYEIEAECADDAIVIANDMADDDLCYYDCDVETYATDLEEEDEEC